MCAECSDTTTSASATAAYGPPEQDPALGTSQGVALNRSLDAPGIADVELNRSLDVPGIADQGFGVLSYLDDDFSMPGADWRSTAALSSAASAQGALPFQKGPALTVLVPMRDAATWSCCLIVRPGSRRKKK